MIDSVFEQGVDFELILMDGGSTDKTHEIINTYHDPRLKLIIMPHRFWNEEDKINSVQTRANIGISLAEGDIFFLSSGHDWFFPGALKIVEKEIGDSIWLMGRLAKVDENGRIVKKIANIRYSCGFIKLDFIRKYGIKLDISLAAADYDLFMQVRKYAGEPKRIEDYLYKYMLHPSALSKKFNGRMKRERKKLDYLYGV